MSPDRWRGMNRALWAGRSFVGIALASLLALALPGCGGGGGGSGGSTVTPEAQLSIDQQPQDQTALEGAEVVLSVVARNATSYEWQRSSGEQWVGVAGATASTLRLPASVDLNGAAFRVVLRGAAGTVTSSAVTIKVQQRVEAPTIVTQPLPMTLMEGQDARFHVTAQGSAPSFRWETRGSDGIWTKADSGDGASLLWPAVTLADSGRCARVTISNSAGEIASEAACLTVRQAPVAPALLTEPADVAGVERGAAAFVVSAIGTPKPTLQWQQLDAGVWTAAGDGSNVLTFSPLTLSDDQRQVRVVATNEAGSITSRVATLRVAAYTYPPAIGAVHRAGGVTAGQSATVSARDVSGIPAPALQWQLSTDGATWLNVNGATSTSYVTPPLPYGVQTRYRLVASSTAGTAISEIISFEPPALRPVITQDLGSVQVTHNGNLRLTVNAQSAAPLTYQWREAKDVGGGASSWVDLAGETAAALHLPHLALPQDDGRRFQVVVRNVAGETVSQTATVTVVNEAMPLVCTGPGEAGWCWVNSRPHGNRLNAGAVWGLNRKLAVGHFGTIQFSDDDGRTWRVRPSGTEADLHGVAYGSASVAVAVGEQGVILRSADGGRQWTRAASGITEHLSAVAASDDGVFLAVGDGGTVLRSADWGNNWQAVTASDPSNPLYDVAFADNSMAVVVGKLGLMRSADAGRTWSAPALRGSSGSALAVAFSRKTAGLGVLAGDSIDRSTDVGATWSPAPGRPIATGGRRAAFPFDDMDDALLVSGNDINAAHSMLTHWGTLEWLTGYFSPTSVVSGKAGGQGFVVGTGGRVRQLRKKTWIEDDGYSATSAHLVSMGFWNGQRGLAVGWGADRMLRGTVIGSEDGGKTWSARSWPNDGLVAVALPAADVAVATTLGGAILRSSDGGRQWTEVANRGTKLNGVAFSGSFGIALGERPHSLNVGFLMRSVDGGLTWNDVGPALMDRPSGVAVQGTTAVVVGAGGLVMRSTDSGATWVSIPTAVTNDLRAVAMNGGSVVLAVGASGRVLRSSDGGATWSAVSSGVSSSLFGVRFATASVAYAFGDSGRVLRSVDGGQTWTEQRRVTAQTWYSGWALDADTVLLGGQDGGILRTTTGGQ